MSRRHNPVFTQTGSLKESGVHHLDPQMMELSSQLASNLVVGERTPCSYAATLYNMQSSCHTVNGHVWGQADKCNVVSNAFPSCHQEPANMLMDTLQEAGASCCVWQALFWFGLHTPFLRRQTTNESTKVAILVYKSCTEKFEYASYWNSLCWKLGDYLQVMHWLRLVVDS